MTAVYELILSQRFAFINLTRFASIGLFRWLLRLCQYGTRPSNEEWEHQIQLTPHAAAECNLLDLFERTATKCILYQSAVAIGRLAALEVKVGNVDLLRQMIDAIHLTFFRPSTTITEQGTMILTQSCIWRLLLLHSIIFIVQEEMGSAESTTRSSTLKAIAEVLNAKVFYFLFSKLEQIAANCLLMRLLGMMIEITPPLIRDFSSVDGFKLLQPHLSKCLPLAVSLFGILFRIPFAKIPYADAILDVNFVAETLLTKDSVGPDFSEVVVASDYLLSSSSVSRDIVLPLLTLIVDCIHCSYVDLSEREVFTSEFILTMLYRAYDLFLSFRRFLMLKTIVEKCCAIILSYSSDDHSASTTKVQSTCALGAAIKSRVTTLLYLIVQDSVRLKNPLVVSFIFPRLPQFGCKCLALLVEKVVPALDFDTANTMVAMFIYLVPSLRSGNVFTLERLLDVADTMVKLIEFLPTIPLRAGDTEKIHDSRVGPLMRDLCCILRTVTVECLLSALKALHASDGGNLLQRAADFALCNIDILALKSPCEDGLEVMVADTSPGETSNMFDILNKSLLSSKVSLVDSAFKSQAMEEVRSLSRLFCMSLISICFSLLTLGHMYSTGSGISSEEKPFIDSSISKDLTRIIVLLCTRKYAYIRRLTSVTTTHSDGNDASSSSVEVSTLALQKGIWLLLPKKEQWTEVVTQIRAQEDDIEGEDERIRTFSLWAQNTVETFPQLESIHKIHMSHFELNSSPSPAKSRRRGSSVGQVTESIGSNTSLTLLSKELHHEYNARLRSFEFLCNKWLSTGFASLSAGAVEWKVIWDGLMCGAIWGQMNDLGGQDIWWKLDMMEGLERSRTRLEQNLFVQYDNCSLIQSSSAENISLPKEVIADDIGERGEDGYNAENLLLRLVRDGVIRKRSSLDAEDEDAETDVLLKARDRETKELSENMDSEVDDVHPASDSLVEPSFESSKPSQRKVLSEEDGFSMRNTVLLDIVRGIVGPSEWLIGKTANVLPK